MKLETGEFVKILEEIATDFMVENRHPLDNGNYRVPTYAEFEKNLLENYGINEKNEVVDQTKWLKYLLSR